MVGELDVAAADDARDVIASAQADAAEVICDVHDVSFIDPRGLRVLLDAAAGARRHNARFTLVNPSASVRRLIDLLGLEVLLQAKRHPVPAASTARRSSTGQRARPVPVCLTRSQETPRQPRRTLATNSTPLAVRPARRAAR